MIQSSKSKKRPGICMELFLSEFCGGCISPSSQSPVFSMANAHGSGVPLAEPPKFSQRPSNLEANSTCVIPQNSPPTQATNKPSLNMSSGLFLCQGMHVATIFESDSLDRPTTWWKSGDESSAMIKAV